MLLAGCQVDISDRQMCCHGHVNRCQGSALRLSEGINAAVTSSRTAVSGLSAWCERQIEWLSWGCNARVMVQH